MDSGVMLNKYRRIQQAIIYPDSQAVLRALSNNFRKALSSLAGQFHLSMIWVPDHRIIFDNEKAEELAKLEATLDEPEVELIPCPLGTIKKDLYMHFEQIA